MGGNWKFPPQGVGEGGGVKCRTKFLLSILIFCYPQLPIFPLSFCSDTFPWVAPKLQAVTAVIDYVIITHTVTDAGIRVFLSVCLSS